MIISPPGPSPPFKMETHREEPGDKVWHVQGFGPEGSFELSSSVLASESWTKTQEKFVNTFVD